MCTPIEAILARRPVEPDSGQALDPRRLEAERCNSTDQRLLEIADVLLDVLPVALEVEDRVTNKLARTVEGRFAAAVRLDDVDLGAFGHVQLALIGAAPEGEDRRMLEEDDRVGNRALRYRACEGSLKIPGLLVRDEVQIEDVRATGHIPAA